MAGIVDRLRETFIWIFYGRTAYRKRPEYPNSPIPTRQPQNYRDVILIFSSHLASLRADPGRLDAVRESRTFRLCLHCIAYRISVCGYLIYSNTSYLKHGAELARLGFVPPPSEDYITRVEKYRSDRQEEKAELTGLLDQARHLGLRQDVDNVTRACQLDLEARRLMCLANDEEDSGRWDKVLRYIAESVHLLSERHESWPSWPDLEQSRQQIMDPVEVYGGEDRHVAEEFVLIHLLVVSYSLLPPHAADVRKHVNFHSRYLDQEVGFMSRFLAERSGKSYVQAVGKLMTGDDKKFCELSIELSVRFGPRLPTQRFGLRLYRLCLRMKDQDLADKVISMRFRENPDQQQVTELLNQLLTKLRYNPRQASNRLILNTEHSDDVIGEYKLPELIKEVVETLPDEPWCVKAFQNRTENVSSRQGDPTTGSSGRRVSTTEEPPSSSSVREFWKNQQTTFDPRKENQEVAHLITSRNSLPDSDICNILFSYIDVPAENPFILRWKERNDVNKVRKINIAAGVPYHCSVLTYHPAQNEWSVRSDMCQISGPLAVEQEGATCVPFVGDCGVDNKPDLFVFKIHKSRSEHALREYTADVRAQSTAAWYVNRFRELTQDRFGFLEMRHSDLVIVYQDSNRDTILELMTREIIFQGGSAVKFDRYINNTKWKNENVNTDLIEAFSHFTHHESGGTLMVTDIQGWVGLDEPRDNISYTLTDPVIHCPAVLHWFGRNNHRQNGINMFYRVIHPTCNHICESLNLVRP